MQASTNRQKKVSKKPDFLLKNFIECINWLEFQNVSRKCKQISKINIEVLTL